MSNRQESFLSKRLDGGAAPLAVGDFVVIVALLTYGLVNHHGTAILNQPTYVATTVAVFLLGWVIFAPLVGAYSAGAAESAKAAVPLAIRSWIPADIVGVLLWSVVRGASSLVSLAIFTVVTILFGAVGLAAWRWLWFKVT